MTSPGSKYTRKKEQALTALLTQRNIEEAARAVGVGTQTLLRWLKNPDFQDEYRQARRAAFGQSISRLQQGSSAAVSVLLKLLVDGNTPPATRVRAADSILNHAGKAMEIEDVQVRLARLEAAQSGNGYRE